MRLFALLSAVALTASTPAMAERADLEGAWTVDLSSEDTPYTKAMQLNLQDDGQVMGSFYDSVIESGRWKTDRGRTCAAFRTSDGAGPYHSAVCFADGMAVGQTWAEHRNFLFNWNATRQAGGE